MMAKEFYSEQEAGKEETTLLLDPYEEEETLSLSDLPIYSGAHSISSAQWGHDFNKEDEKNTRPNNNNDDDDDDFFEFFSEEFTTSTSATTENIIFCGKLIPIFKDPQHMKGNSKKKLNIESSNTVQKGSSALHPSYEECFKKASQESKCAKSNEYSSLGKVSLVRSTTKSRWFLFMFGMSRLSSNTEMELSDIRSRQRRSRTRRGPVAVKMFSTQEQQGEEVKMKVSSNYKGLWKVLRSISLGLGCKSSKLANDVVKAAFV